MRIRSQKPTDAQIREALQGEDWTAAPGKLGSINVHLTINGKDVKIAKNKLMKIAGDIDIQKVNSKVQASVQQRSGSLRGRILNAIYEARKSFHDLRSKGREPMDAPLLEPEMEKEPITFEGSVFETVGEKEVLDLQKQVQQVNPHYKEKISLAALKEQGRLPSHKITVEGVNYYCSDPFYMAGNHCSVGLVQIGKKVYPRLFYLSNSQGGWRVAPFAEKKKETIAKMGKGVNEADTQLPLTLSLALHQLPRVEQPSEQPVPKNLLQTVGMIEIPEEYSTAIESEPLLPEELTPPPTFTEKKRVPFTDKPEAIPLPAKELLPNFANSTKSQMTLPHYGEVTATLVPSNNGSLSYLFYELPSGHAFLAAVEKVEDNPINKYGARRISPDLSHSDAPLFEYYDQIPERFRTIEHFPGLENERKYESNWNYVRELELMKMYYKQLGKEMPPAQHVIVVR